jgi:hypothetical protein
MVNKTDKKRWVFGLMIILIAGFFWVYAFEADTPAQKAPEKESDHDGSGQFQ